jgi:hypothetical protein
MIFEHSHFQNAMLPGDFMKCIRILEALDERLKEILFEEIEEGNRIFDVTAGWPEKDGIMVQMRFPFKKKHRKLGVDYKTLQDPHYWKEEYSTGTPAHFLICPFENIPSTENPT